MDLPVVLLFLAKILLNKNHKKADMDLRVGVRLVGLSDGGR